MQKLVKRTRAKENMNSVDVAFHCKEERAHYELETARFHALSLEKESLRLAELAKKLKVREDKCARARTKLKPHLSPAGSADEGVASDA